MEGINFRGRVKWHTWFTPILYLAVVFLPVLALLYRTINSGPDNLIEPIIPSGRTLVLFGRSILLALQVSAMTLVIGVPAGLFLWKNNKGIFHHARWLLLAVLAVPPEIHALSWNTAISFFMVAVGNPGNIPEGWSMLLWVETVSLLPITAGMTLLVLESINRDYIETSRIFKSTDRVIESILLPLAAPVIMASAGLIFVLCITDTTLPVLYRQNVYSFELFSEFSSGGDAVRVFLMSLPLFITAGLVIFLSQSGLRTAALTPSSEQLPIHSSSRLSNWLSIILWVSFAIISACFILPFVVLMTQTGSLSTFTSIFGNSLDETGSTFMTAVLTSVIAIPVGLGGARLIKRKPLWFLVILPLAIPAPLVAIGLIETWNHPSTQAIYASPVMTVFSSLARFAPLAAILLHAQQSRMEQALVDASRMLKSSAWKNFMRVHLPLMIPGITVSLAVVFTLAASELGASMLVTPAGHTSLMMKIYNYLHYGSSSGVAALSLVLVLVIALGILALLGFSRLLLHGIRLEND